MTQGSSLVLARKYRPKVFSDLIGQEALVQTITNAIEQNRLSHAYMLTGIRGIGKTSSARIIAKGLNCVGPDGHGGMTPNPCGQCPHCLGISSDSDIDVIEIDAASNTGVDNVREIIEGAKYNPVSSRFKIYIIDEVHMLSKAAFNALLKTLEEPPERVKFILATTEIRKVPVTILSRCQRFDLKRVSEEVLLGHLKKIVQLENRDAEETALHLITLAAEGSVRDALSLLDQALTQVKEKVTLKDVQMMLGVFDENVLIELYQMLLEGKIVHGLELLKQQFECGADALSCVQDLLSLTHWLTRAKIVPDLLENMMVSEERRNWAKKILPQVSMVSLTSIWQVLLKGTREVKEADNPFMALEMLLIKLSYLSEVPSIQELAMEIKKKNENISTIVPVVKEEKAKKEISEVVKVCVDEELALKEISDFSKLARKHKELILAFNIENCVRLSEVKDSTIICSLIPETPVDFQRDFLAFLKEKTGRSWTLSVQEEAKSHTMREAKEIARTLLYTQLEQYDLVKSVLKSFPNSKITRVSEITQETESSEN